MDDLIQLVTTKVGIDADKAKGAVETVVGFLKDKLPEPIANQIQGVLSGEAGEGGGLGGIAKGIGSMLGK